MKTLIKTLSALTFAAVLAVGVYAADSTVVVSGNTSGGENQPGWLFNRDVTTATPFEFNNDEASIGSGSLYVMPIGANAADKFIGENFINSSISELNSISYDFKIGSGGEITDEHEFYMNVYANFGQSPDDKFYDCRYNIVPTTGSLSGWTTVTFDPTVAYPVTTSGTSPFTCPLVPADMDLQSSNSTIRVFALNVGDTSANDAGLDGYLDNVVVNMDSGVTTYDFEAEVVDTEAPDVEITAPVDGAVVSGMVDVYGSVEDENPLRYYAVVKDATNTVVAGPGTVYEDESFVNSFLFTWDTSSFADGTYTIHLEARDQDLNKDAGSVDVITVVVDNTPEEPVGPQSKDECKKGGWMTFFGMFKNQGQCVSSVASGR